MPKSEYDDVVGRICEDFVQGRYKSRTELAERYGVTWDTIRRLLAKNGIDVPKIRHDEYVFDVYRGESLVFEKIRMTDFVSWFSENVKNVNKDTTMKSIRKALKGRKRSAYGFRFVINE